MTRSSNCRPISVLKETTSRGSQDIGVGTTIGPITFGAVEFGAIFRRAANGSPATGRRLAMAHNGFLDFGAMSHKPRLPIYRSRRSLSKLDQAHHRRTLATCGPPAAGFGN